METTVRAKFKVTSITQFEFDAIKVEMNPVYGDSPENQQFWKATPTGKIEMQINNPDTTSLFAVGAEYYVDFSKA
ncbi:MULTISPECIES: hypothetical protein [Cyanophyceae]|uniref:hypothetical protein n=1 Tax=Cyanophyceae TaxID=3028117 RepID=UPI00168915B7|nr:hypothetical protein [Trichocoleus sp. FACHB-40]MBD2005624.1 hypothetical protein [Trichocoleus sp. FACHB-40]